MDLIVPQPNASTKQSNSLPSKHLLTFVPHFLVSFCWLLASCGGAADPIPPLLIDTTPTSTFRAIAEVQSNTAASLAPSPAGPTPVQLSSPNFGNTLASEADPMATESVAPVAAASIPAPNPSAASSIESSATTATLALSDCYDFVTCGTAASNEVAQSAPLFDAPQVAAVSSAAEPIPIALALASPAGVSAVAVLATSPQTEDFFAVLDPRKGLSEQGWQGLNCYGTYPQLRDLREPGLTGSRMQNGQSLRFGRVVDPTDATRQAFVVRTQAADPLTAGAHRCEVLTYPTAGTALPMREPIWYAFRIMVWDGAESMGDDQLLSQWRTPGFNPFWGLYMRDGKLRIETRYDNRPLATKATEVLSTPWIDKSVAPRRWSTFVVQAKISPFNSDGPFLRVWRDGSLIVSQSGPIGYNSPELSHAKLGYYQWTQLNQWDTRVPVRTVYIAKAGLIKDAEARLDEPTMRSWVEAP